MHAIMPTSLWFNYFRFLVALKLEEKIGVEFRPLLTKYANNYTRTGKSNFDAIMSWRMK